MSRTGLERLQEKIIRCRRCPRLVRHRREVARVRVARFRDQPYWGRPVPSFGDPRARILLVGLAPAAHGANRTGRMFTGDRSGEFLFAALHRAGLATRPESTGRDDGLRLRGAYITAALRCAPPANRPDREEELACRPFLVAEMDLLSRTKVVVALGALAWRAILSVRPAEGARGRPSFAHGREIPLAEGPALIGCYHPSQQNTFTGRLTAPMIDAVLLRARRIAGMAREGGAR